MHENVKEMLLSQIVQITKTVYYLSKDKNEANKILEEGMSAGIKKFEEERINEGMD